MISLKDWINIVGTFEGKRAKVFCVDGTVYEGIGGPDCEEEDSDGDNVYAITLDLPNQSSGMIFIQEDVEKIEFLD